ncbi:MAG: Re/Si-specific NAD(P)(+) transhydrogenase subunit alpha [Gracilimonas sp.]|uniref:Re/Si-specific NAD(P)(+) transhydrogenase subunit alpha n=1 Tax=Gracilimonas sp. TaxID=1974203 RepID=UPI0019868F94|nr:Re/Si-specific NAD(P)(+) transhydrogenase subunit alpha [Gracilimonas sp.]MBD3617787.1 Re/Si-specific NAD(P)(+) transhydrogenase subunit alpha [Gracilimonas sp.]
MIVGVLKETAEHERRVALTPEVATQIVKQELEVWVEANAGSSSNFPNGEYETAGAQIAANRDEIISKSNILLTIHPPSEAELTKLKKNSILICLLWARQHPKLVDTLKKLGISALGMDFIPRISRAQNMDVLSSMSSIAGYKSALIAANELDKYLPMMMTAAGTIPPSKSLVLGAGVAGLQAIATLKRLGSVVEAFDIRPEVKEQVESLGAKFVEVPLEEAVTQTEGGYAKELDKSSQDRQREVIHEHAKKSDIVITTALIPGRPAPLLITKEMVADMSPGSVIVDIASENGGNCELTEHGKTVEKHGVKIVGPNNLPSQLSLHASKLYSKNMYALLNLLIKDGKPNFDFEDEILLNTTVTHQGEIISPMLKE